MLVISIMIITIHNNESGTNWNNRNKLEQLKKKKYKLEQPSVS